MSPIVLLWIAVRKTLCSNTCIRVVWLIFPSGKHVYMFPPSHPNSPSVYHAMRLVQCMKEDRLGRVSVSIVEYVGIYIFP